MFKNRKEWWAGCGLRAIPNAKIDDRIHSTPHGKNRRPSILKLGIHLMLIVLAGLFISQAAQADDQPSDFDVECAVSYQFTVTRVTDPANPGGPKVLPNDIDIQIGPEGLNEPFLVEKDGFSFTDATGAGFTGPPEDTIYPTGQGIGQHFVIQVVAGQKLTFRMKIKLKFNNKIELKGFWTVNGAKSDNLPTVKFRAGETVDDDYWLIINDTNYELGVINAGILNNQPDVPFNQFVPGEHGLGVFSTVPDFSLEPFDPNCQSLVCPDRKLFDISALFGETFTPGLFSYFEGQIVDSANPREVLADFLLKHEAPREVVHSLNEWALIIMGLLLLVTGAVVIIRQRGQMAV